MLSRFSVKKPYIIVVAVIIALIVGGVSLSRIKTDLLPQMDLPYLAVITTDPGASAEKVEEEVTKVLEGPLGKVSGVSSISSQSADNYSMIFLEFEDGTDMDSALVKVSSAVNEASTLLPENAGNPNYMELSMDMMASVYTAVSYDGKDIYQLSDFVNDTVIPEYERLEGVADVTTVGTVEKTVEVRLSDSKIEDVNNKLLGSVNSKLYDAKKAIDEGEAQIAQAEDQIKQQQDNLAQKQTDTANQLGSGSSELTAALSSLNAAKIAAITSAIAAGMPEDQATAMASAQFDSQIEEVKAQLAAVESGEVNAASGFGSGSAQLAAGLQQLESSKSQVKDARSQYEDSREKALSQANINKLVDKDTLAQIIKAQDFSMPAGYLKSDSEDQWLLRVGTEIKDVSALNSLLLADIDGVGEIRLGDVADITVLDNTDGSYMRLNGEKAIMLSIFKNSTAGTTEVSDECEQLVTDLQKKYEGLHLITLSDQGQYVDLYIQSILRSLLLGALLAIVVLALFLRNLKPTLIVAFSIPFSVLVAFIFMYFSGIQINVMSLGGISLAIGMLVDNSIIVMENIYRLRGRGIPAPQAAVQGAKQITGAVIASTLTTICVFAPIVFTTGLVNQLMMPFALTIAYVLAASLLVALTLVPTVSSFVFKNYKERKPGWFEKVQRGYARSLEFVLRHKVLPLGVATVLLVAAVVGVVNTGVTLIPTMTGKTLEVQVVMPEDVEKQDAYELADKVMDVCTGVEGVKYVGALDGTASMGTVSSSFGSVSDDSGMYKMFSFNILTDESVNSEPQVQQIMDTIADQTKDFDCEVVTDASSSNAMSSMLGSGLSLSVRGPSQQEALAFSEKVMDEVKQVEGYTEVDNGMKDADKEINLIIDKDKLTKEGYTVAQLYADLAGRLKTESNSTTLTVDGAEAQVKIVDETDPITPDNLLDTEIEITNSQSGETNTIKLGDVATVEESLAATTVVRVDSAYSVSVTAEIEDGYNNALLSRDLRDRIDNMDIPEGYSVRFSGEVDNIDTMLSQMLLLLILGFVLIYLIMVAQFQSLLSPFIILFTVPLAFTGGFFGLVFAGEPLSMLALMGFAVLMGTVVNNGIVFVDYVNQLRRGGLEKRMALVASGKTRMRPILMTALTTILAMLPMVFSTDLGASMERGMALVVVGGLVYSTFMTLYIIPVMYDLLYRRVPREIELDDDLLDADVNDAQAYLESLNGKHAAV